MFDGPEYGSYIQLCSELRLERQLSPGDWMAQVTEWNGEPQEPHVFLVSRDDHEDGTAAAWSARRGQYIWLPRLDQWLVMLEEIDPLTSISLDKRLPWKADPDGALPWRCRLTPCAALKPLIDGYGPTREEAAARLWMAVTLHVEHGTASSNPG